MCGFGIIHFLNGMRIKLLYILTILGTMLSSCYQDTTDRVVSINFERLKLDSSTVRLYHAITGREVAYTVLSSFDTPWILDSLNDDVYILVISWPRTFISHNTYSDPLFDKDSEDIFQLTKPIYIDKDQSTAYTIYSPSLKDKGYFELNGVDSIFLKSHCTDCELADEYWEIYNTFFVRKNQLLEQLRERYYLAVDNDDIQAADSLFKKLSSTEGKHFKDDQLDNEIIAKVEDHPESAASTYFLFYQLYHYRDFDRFRETFETLAGDARKTRYYNMVKKQYLEKYGGR